MRDIIEEIKKRIEELEESNRRDSITLNRKTISSLKREYLKERMICREASIQELKKLLVKFNERIGEQVKILKIYRDEEPNSCDACGDEWNGYNFCLVRLFKGFDVWIALCDDCLEKLKKKVSK
jgi:hypothetical protein